MNPFKSLCHYFATAINRFLTVEPKIEAGAAQIEAAMPGVEAVTAVVPVYGPAAVTIEKVGEMALGGVVAVLHALGEAGKAKLIDAGLDETLIQTAEDVYSKMPGYVTTMVSAVKAKV